MEMAENSSLAIQFRKPSSFRFAESIFSLSNDDFPFSAYSRWQFEGISFCNAMEGF
jgi:hypothetical protein